MPGIEHIPGSPQAPRDMLPGVAGIISAAASTPAPARPLPLLDQPRGTRAADDSSRGPRNNPPPQPTATGRPTTLIPGHMRCQDPTPPSGPCPRSQNENRSLPPQLGSLRSKLTRPALLPGHHPFWPCPSSLCILSTCILLPSSSVPLCYTDIQAHSTLCPPLSSGAVKKLG